MRKLITALMACAALSIAVAAQNAAISGTVKDQNGDPISGARVTLRRTDASGAIALATDREGAFEFRSLTSGSYSLSVSAPGFSDVIQTASPGTPVAITLLVGQPNLVVSAEVNSVELKANVPQPVNVISAESILQRSSSVLAQAATEEAGLNYQRTSPTLGAIVIRGLTGKNVVNYVDGVRYTHGGQRGGINTFFNLNDASMLQSIEVLRGPNGAQYGSDSLSGTVNLITRSPASGFAEPEWHGEINPSFGLADRSLGSSALVRYGTKHFGGYVNVYGRAVGDVRTADGVDSHSALTRFLGLSSRVLYTRNPYTGFDQYGFATRLNWTPANDQELSFFYHRGQQDNGKRFDQLVGGDGNLIADLRNLMLDFGYLRYVKSGVGFFDSLSLTASYNSQREERVNQGGQGNPFGDITHQYERTTTWGGSGFLDKRFGTRNTFLVGADIYREQVTAPAYTVNGTTLAVSLSRPRVPDDVTFTSIGVFVQDQWNAIPDRLRITGALRYSRVRYFADGTKSPVVGGRQLWTTDELTTKGIAGRLGAVIKATDNFSFFANYSRGFRYPSITDLGTLGLTGDGFEVDHITSGNLGGTIGSTVGTDAVNTGIPVSKQRSEISNNFDVGARYDHKRFDASFTWFRLDINDAIVKQALILPQGAVGKVLGSDVITSQLPSGVVFVAASGNPVLVRTNFTDAKVQGVELEANARITDHLRFRGNFTYTKAEDKATGVPPNIEGGTPPPTGFLSLRHDWRRFWIEPYVTLAGRQDRFSIGDLADRRTGATRTRTQIENYFRRGACVLGLTFNAAGTCNANVNTYILRPTGENITQVLTRVLGPGFPASPLTRALPGYGLVNVRGGISLRENMSFVWAFENILDQFHRNPSWGIDGTGRNFKGGLRIKF